MRKNSVRFGEKDVLRHDRSSTMKQLSHFCDWFEPRSCQVYTDWVSDWSEASSRLLGLITDFHRQQSLRFV